MKYIELIGEICVVREVASTFIRDEWTGTLFRDEVCVVLSVSYDDTYEGDVAYVAHILSQFGLCNCFVNFGNIVKA